MNISKNLHGKNPATGVFFILLLLVLLPGADVFPQLPEASGRGVRISDAGNLKAGNIEFYETSRALVIGVANYTKGWPQLPEIQDDIKEVSRVLADHGFEVEREVDPGHNRLREIITRFMTRDDLSVNSRLLIYFAGHGYTASNPFGGVNMGYIVPADAPIEGADRSTLLSDALPLAMFEVYSNAIISKHALFVFDSCFSGSIFGSMKSAPKGILHKLSEPARMFITSGGEGEEVPSRSIFRRQFVKALEGEADLDDDDYVTGTELGEYLQASVIEFSRDMQHPQYGKLRDPIYQGDIVFDLRYKASGYSRVERLPTFDPYASAMLFIGVQRFSHDRFTLVPYAVDDAVDLAHLLSLEFKNRLVHPSRVMLALSGEPQKRKSQQRLDALLSAGAVRHPAGQTDVLRLIEEQARSVDESGAFMVFFSTHGFSSEGGTHYLAAADSLLRYPESALSTSKVLDIVARSRAVRRLAFLDACRERLTQEAQSTGADPRSAVSERLAREVARSRGQVVFFAAPTGGCAYDDHKRRNGVFTATLIDGLRCDAEIDTRGIVTADTLATFVNKKVAEWLHDGDCRSAQQGIQVNLEGPARDLPLANCAVGLSPTD